MNCDSKVKNIRKYIISIFLILIICEDSYPQSDIVNQYSVCWNTPSENSAGSMPIGNGEVGANVWMEKNGNLLFYLSRTDAWAENSALYKLGKIRVSLFPFVIDSQTSFKQYLNLEKGFIEFDIQKETEKVELKFFVDNESPIVYLQGKSTYPLQVYVSSEIWRTQTRLLPVSERHFSIQNTPFDSLAMEYADKIVENSKCLMVYHRNEHSIYPFTIKHQGLQLGAREWNDPFLNRTMGYSITGCEFSKISPTILATDRKVNNFTLKIVAYTEQTNTADDWINKVQEIAKQAPSFDVALRRTALWWKEYWNKSYIIVHTPDQIIGDKITQAYILQNWMTACAGRGNYPIKFNGSIFTVDPEYTDPSKNYSPDYRSWGPDYWWQNTRLMYHPMLKSGDFEMMQVLFQHYNSILPILKQNAKTLWNTQGAVNPETATIFGTTVNSDYGWIPHDKKQEMIENPYVRHYWSSGLEIVALMCDYYCYTQDFNFAVNTLIPFADEILKFYMCFFPRNEKGKIQISPTHSLETYWENVKNDLPNVAGLHYVLANLLTLPDDCLSKTKRKEWKRFQQLIPEIPIEKKDGEIIFSPAEEYDPKRMNGENPDLYGIFPFSLCNFSTSNCQIGINTFHNRIFKRTDCWTQDGQQAARLGLTDEAKENLLAKLENKNPNHRFPVIWGPNYDWTPDQDHGANLLLTLQEMVMQTYENTVYLLPSFPINWDVSFKLYTPQANKIEGCYSNGNWRVKPVLDKKTGLKIKLMTK